MIILFSGPDWDEKGEVLLVDKPLDWTSFDVVKKIRSLFHIKKVGHAGTLDPKATGLLILCTGAQTKSIGQFVGFEKEYRGTMELGVKTPSHDSETEEIERQSASFVTADLLRSTAREFLGKQRQVPPMYSAAKMGGRPLYRYARRGDTVERTDKEIEIKEFEILRFDLPFVDFRVVCSKGTYIRSLSDDFGRKLGCGAVLRALRRTRIGPYNVENALTIDQLIRARDDLRNRPPVPHEGHVSV